MATAPNIMDQTDPAVLQQRYEAEQAQKAGQSGGPGMTGDPGAAPPDAQAQTQVKKPLYKTFGREFENAEDLIEYTKEMERQTVESRLTAERLGNQSRQNTNTLQNQTQTQVPKQEGPGVEDLLFTDPKKALDLHAKNTRESVMREINAKEAEKNFWAGFYEKNPDLRNAERIVQSVVKEKWNEVSSLPLAEAERILAGETRAIVKQIQAPGERTELPKTSASSLPASGASAPVVVAAQGESTSFVDQLRKFQRTKKH